MIVFIYQILVAADVGSSYLGDIAVDDFKLDQTPCSLGKFLYCKFEIQVIFENKISQNSEVQDTVKVTYLKRVRYKK